MQYTFASFSFGCRVNHAEKQRFDQELLALGYVYDNANPNIYIINTCAVTAKAERGVRQFIYQIKKKLPNCKIILTGCAATFWQQNKINNKLPIDLVIPNSDKEKLCETINKLCHPEPSLTLKGSNDKFLQSGRYLLKIQDGCPRFCSYCIVPYLRGKPKSTLIKNLKFQILNLNPYIKEVVLTAINTEAFGNDTGETLIRLIQTTLNTTNISRISFGSIHPWSINTELLNYYKTIANNPRFVNFFHIPLQSGCNRILKFMKRDYSIKDIRNKIYELNSINPRALIATDIIVGFLDETDSDFDKTYKLLEELPISKFHVFKFSKRSHTAADFMAKQMTEPTPQEKNKRSQSLIALGNKKYQKFLQTLVGWKSSALMIGDVNDGYQTGLLENQVPMMVKTNKNLLGQIKLVKTLQLKYDKLIGELI